MRNVKYCKHWSFAGPAVKAEAPLADFLLDIIYLMENGVIPPLHVLNEVLRTGGSNGGMSPGTTWRKFEIRQAEYEEVVNALLNINVIEAKRNHPYLFAHRIVRDEELERCPDYISWLNASFQKYPLTPNAQ